MSTPSIPGRQPLKGGALLSGNVLWLLIMAAFGGVMVLLVVRPWNKDAGPMAEPFPLTSISSSPYLNTGANAHYVGSDACRKCHEDRHASFRRTGMGRSMA